MFGRFVNNLTGRNFWLAMGDGSLNSFGNSVTIQSREGTRFPDTSESNDVNCDVMRISLGYEFLSQKNPNSVIFDDNIMRSIIRFLARELKVSFAENMKVRLDSFAARETHLRIAKSIQPSLIALFDHYLKQQQPSATPPEYTVTAICYRYSNIELTIVSNTANKKLDSLRDNLLQHLQKYHFEECRLESRVPRSPASRL